MWHSTSGAKVNRLQNATCGVQKKRVVCNYITIYRTHILFIEHIHQNVHTRVHPTHNHSQCTLHTHKHSHTILSYTRSPATEMYLMTTYIHRAVPHDNLYSPSCTSWQLTHYIKYNLSSSERSAMAQFRCGILPLNIETRRFRNQALDERLCTLCEFNEIEDESHFLFQCSLYDELKREWVSHIVNKTANFLELDKINKFKVVFDIHHRITTKYILRCYQLRKESLYRI